MIEKENEKNITNDKKIYDYSSFHSDSLFVCKILFLEGFQKEVPSEECQIPKSNSLFNDEVSHVKKIEDEVLMDGCKTLFLLS